MSGFIGLGLGINMMRSGASALPFWQAPEHILDTVTPSVFLDALNNRYALNNAAANVSDLITVTNASTARRFLDSDGVWKAAPANTPVFDFSTGRRRLLLTGSRTNQIRNNSMVGAVAGSPGTNPTNWSIVTAPAGITSSIVEVGTQNGIDYIDYRYVGTTGDANGIEIAFENSTAIAAANGQTCAQSMFVAMVGGSFANITNYRMNIRENTGAGVFVRNNFSTVITSAPPSSVADGLISFSATLGGGGTVGAVRPFLVLTIPSGVAIDITLRIGWPQLEQNSIATPPIVTSNAAVTVTADTCQLTSAAAAVFQGAAAVALRGTIPAAGTAWPLLGLPSGIALARHGAGTPSQFLIVGRGDGNGLLATGAPFPGSFGGAMSWGAAGRNISANGGSAASDANVVNVARSSVFIGGSAGLSPNQIIRVEQLVGWALTNRASNAGIEAQARLAA